MSAGSPKRPAVASGRGAPSIARTANALLQARKLKAVRHLLPRCTATAKSTGEQCRDLAMPNGKCFRHGGATPKGADWHKRQWPNGKRPDAIAKAEEKILAHAKKAKRRERRLAAMSPEERQAHDVWQKSHRPGPPAARAQARADRVTAAEICGLMSAEPVTAQQTTAEATDLAAAREFLRRQSEATARRQSSRDPEQPSPPETYQGAFS